MTRGLDPTVAIALSVLGVLLGVLLGGLVRLRLDRRAEQARVAQETKAAARVMYEDLWRVAELIGKHSIQAAGTEHGRAVMRLDAWQATRLTLASLDRETWDALRTAVAYCDALRRVESQTVVEADRIMHWHGLSERAAQSVKTAAEALGRVAGHGDVHPDAPPRG